MKFHLTPFCCQISYVNVSLLTCYSSYSDIINEYIAYLNNNEISSDGLNVELNEFRLKSEKLYNEIIMTFSVPEYWKTIVVEDFEQLSTKLVDREADIEEILLNLLK